MPVVSVVMSVYNESENWLRAAIDSILQQSFKDFEFLIINDHPEGEINKVILREYQKQDHRIVLIENETNIGLTKSLNKGLDHARGKYIARMDADDISCPDRFEKQVLLLDSKPEIGVCGSNILIFGEKNCVQKYPQTDEECFIFQRSPFAHPAVMIRSAVLKKFDLHYNPEYYFAQDYELWCRMHQITKFYNLQELLLKYRVTGKQITKKRYREQQFFAAQIRRTDFITYWQSKGVIYNLPESISIADIKALKNLVLKNIKSSREQSVLKDFYYYMYRSVEATNPLVTISHFVCNGDVFRMHWQKGVKVIAYNLFRKRIVKIL